MATKAVGLTDILGVWGGTVFFISFYNFSFCLLSLQMLFGCVTVNCNATEFFLICMCMYVCMCMETLDNVPIVCCAVAARITKISVKWEHNWKETLNGSIQLAPLNPRRLEARDSELIWVHGLDPVQIMSYQINLASVLGLQETWIMEQLYVFFLNFYCFCRIMQRCVTVKLVQCSLDYKTSADF